MKSNVDHLVSVIIPCFNDHKYIGQAINSVTNQTHKNVEIIIVDDGSDEVTLNFLKAINQENVEILYQKNSGPSAARNTGIKHAKGDFILTLDSDDYFENSFISTALSYLIDNFKIGLVSCWINVFNDTGILEKFKPEGGDLKKLLLGNGASAGSVLFRKQCWLEIGGYDENMRKGYEDWEFNISVVKAGWEIALIEEYLFNYRQKVKSRNIEANKSHKYELWKYIYIKHKDLWSKHHELLVNNLFFQMEALEQSSHNLRKTMDYKLGKMILRPFRFVKSFFNPINKTKKL